MSDKFADAINEHTRSLQLPGMVRSACMCVLLFLALVWLIGCGDAIDGDRVDELNRQAVNNGDEAHVCGWLDGAKRWGYWSEDGWVTACDLNVDAQSCIPLACHVVQGGRHGAR